MGLASYAEIDDTRLHYSTQRKYIGVGETIGRWYDDSMLAGIPAANYYATEPLVAATLNPRRGIRHTEPDPATSEHLLSVFATGQGGTNSGPQHYLLCDYLLYYPFIDGDSNDEQPFDNTVTLPRFTSGTGVRAVIVCQGAGSGSPAYTVNYTNDQGVSGRSVTSGGNVATTTQVLSANLGSGYLEPFVPLMSGDNGMRSVESITFNGTAPGGIYALLLVKPIATFAYAENEVAAETVFPHLPLIPDGAVLHTLRKAAVGTAAPRYLETFYTTIRS